MSSVLQELLEQARQLSVDERQELTDLRLKGLAATSPQEEEIAAALAMVQETSGSMAGLDRTTFVQLAEDEEFCGH